MRVTMSSVMSLEQLNQLRCHLLIIDDDEEITKTLYRQFRRNCSVFIATHAQEAYDILSREEIHVILCDQRMPKMSGTEFLASIRKRYPKTVFLVLTGYSDIHAIIEAINTSQIYRYIAKPWNPEELNIVVQQAFEKYRLTLANYLLIEQLTQNNQELELRVQRRTQELARANQQLTELNQQKDRFLGIVAHDLRNPLSGLNGYCELLLNFRHVYSEDNQQRFLGEMHNIIEQMTSLVSELLDVSRINLGKLTLRKESIALQAYLTELLNPQILIANKKQIQLIFRYLTDVVEFEFDPERMRQVFNNLISNAIKFSSSDTHISFIVEQQGDFLTFAVHDEGMGISDIDLQNVFCEFHQGDIQKDKKRQGVGLGLAICKNIVEAHHGKISCKSILGKGSQFTVALPLNITNAL